MKNLVIWFIGSNGSGKTTNARLIHEHFRAISGTISPPILIKKKVDGVDIKYTKFSPYTTNLGDLTTQQCGGTDTLNTKIQIDVAYQECCRESAIVVVEGIMATAQWIDILRTPDSFILLIYLHMSEGLNFERVKSRRAEKKGLGADEIILKEKTLDNLRGKLRGFESLYNKMKDQVDEELRIDVDGLEKEEIFEWIRASVESIIEQNQW